MQNKPYGSWRSPITTSMIVDASLKLGDIFMDGQTLYWNETRPSEQGRSVIVKWDNGMASDILPSPYNARSRVHEYGGASFCIHQNYAYFSNAKDQHLYEIDNKGNIKALTTHDAKRYAQPIIDAKRQLLYAIEEYHLSPDTVINRIVKLSLETHHIDVIHEGEDFYGMLTLHPQGNQLAFISWNHPNMPWDGSHLWVGDLNEDGTFRDSRTVAGNANTSIFQPQWSPEGTLFFISDQTGFWNLYRFSQEGVQACYPMGAEFGQPLWVLGMSRYAFLDNGKIACIYTIKGIDFLGILDPNTQTLEALDLPFNYYSNLKSDGQSLYFIGASPTEMKTIMCFDFETVQRIRCSKDVPIDSGYLSTPQPLEFPTDGEKSAFAFFYPPKNKDFESSGTPPLIVKSHGGPSAHATADLNLEVQYWTSRGFAYLDVNYGGSTGYGREYRERLKGQWGIVDVNDCTHGALYLAQQGMVNKDQLIIKGSSAGGYTTLAALTFENAFCAGASYYGVSDLEALATDTHKFEAHYLDSLIGSYPEEKQRYIDRSPIHFTDQLSCPIILLQGAEDAVVPPSQAETLFHAMELKQIPVAYILFEDEQHGFRIAANMKKALEAELYFYATIFNLSLSDPIAPITIHNFPSS